MIAIPNMSKPDTCDMCPIEGCEYINGKFTCPLIEIIPCKECKHRPIKDDPDGADYGFNIVAPTDGDDLCPCLVEDGWYSWMPEDNFYCGRGERRTETLDERIKRGLKEMRPNLEWLERRNDMNRTHKIKLEKEYCDSVYYGDKTFEVRYNDRGYQKGDFIRFIPVDGLYSISHPIIDKEYEITYVHSGFGLGEMFVVFGIKEKIDETDR